MAAGQNGPQGLLLPRIAFPEQQRSQQESSSQLPDKAGSDSEK